MDTASQVQAFGGSLEAGQALDAAAALLGPHVFGVAIVAIIPAVNPKPGCCPFAPVCITRAHELPPRLGRLVSRLMNETLLQTAGEIDLTGDPTARTMPMAPINFEDGKGGI